MKLCNECVLLFALVFVVLSDAHAQIVDISPGDDLAALVQAYPEGTIFQLSGGTYRGVGNILLKNGQQIIGELGPNGERKTLLNGAMLLLSWFKEGSYWVCTVSGESPVAYGNMYKGFSNICSDLYMDDILMRQVVSLADLDTLVWDRDIWPIGVYEQLDLAQSMQHGTWFYDTASQKIYMKDDPAGHKMELSHVGNCIYSNASNGGQGCIIRNIIVEKYATKWSYGAIQMHIGQLNKFDGCPDYNKAAAIVDNCEIRLNHSCGILLAGCGTGFRMLNCHIHHNGQMGAIVMGTYGATVEGCKISYNCFERTIGFIPSENGGFRLKGDNNATNITGNYVRRNWDSGIWIDGNNANTTIDGNICEKNTGAGIFLEVNEPRQNYMDVRFNVSRRNGYCGWFYAAQIMLAATHSANVNSNVLEVDWVQGGHAFCIVYQIDDGYRKENPPHHTHFHNNDVTWNKPNICPGQDIVPWQPTVAGNTKHGWGVSIWGGALGGAATNVADSIKLKRLEAYNAQSTCVDTCAILFENNMYHCEGAMAETEKYKYWRWPESYPDTNDYDNDGSIDYDYDMTAYSLKGMQDSLGQELGSTVDDAVDTNIAGQLRKISQMGAPDALVSIMGAHVGLSLSDITGYTGSMQQQEAAHKNAETDVLHSGSMLKLRMHSDGVYTVSLYDARGRCVLRRQFEPNRAQARYAIIDTGDISRGIYSLHMKNGAQCAMRKVMLCR
jgi:hypothetical protein